MKHLVISFVGALFLAACSAEMGGDYEDAAPPPPPTQVEPEPQPVEPQPQPVDPVATVDPDDTDIPPQPSGIGDLSPGSMDPLAAAMAEMRTYPIAYETPTEATVGEPFDVTLAIDATGDDSAVEGLPGNEVIVEGEARLSNTVEATLSGGAFDIVLTNRARQRLSPLRESTWRWSVTPLRDGPQYLYLEIHAVLGPDESMLLDSFDDEINVAVAKAPGSAVDTADNIRIYVSVIGGILSIILGSIALSGHLRGKKKDEDKSAD